LLVSTRHPQRGRALDREEAGEALVEQMHIGSAWSRQRCGTEGRRLWRYWSGPTRFSPRELGTDCRGSQRESTSGEKGKHSAAIAGSRCERQTRNIDYRPLRIQLERARKSCQVLTVAGWFDLTAVREAHVAVADGNKYFNVQDHSCETVEIIAEFSMVTSRSQPSVIQLAM